MDLSMLAAYLPIDRCIALVRGESLPEQASGAALFADISGFTPLTETLFQEFGPRQGGEKLTYYLNLVYNTLVNQVHSYHGSVIFFSGDGITCWFGAEDASNLTDATLRATSAALAIQSEMKNLDQIETPSGQTLTLALKVAVVTGPVRRFVAGNPDVQKLDILAGATLERLAQAEHLATKGEILIGSEVVELLGGNPYHLTIKEWRTASSDQAAFGVLDTLAVLAEINAWPILPEEAYSITSRLREWVLPAVYKRLKAELGSFLTELRPVAVLFLSFEGLDYDQDPEAASKLDSFIQTVQAILSDYEGTLLQVTLGDKGSYLYCALGAPLAHQDDCERAVLVGQQFLDLPNKLKWLQNLKIGISQGIMRCGDYGGTTRHTYGVLGNEVNLSARLMQMAQPGQILVSSRVQKSIGDHSRFKWESLPAVKLKGKTESVNIFALVTSDERKQLLARSDVSRHSSSMVGREKELALVTEKLRQVQANQGQVIVLSGEAGIGKSRLLAEIIQLATKEFNFAVLSGECHSYATNSAYHSWQPIFQAFFGLNTTQSPPQQFISIEAELLRLNADFRSRLPLLSAVLGISIEDNTLTSTFSPKLRKTSLEALLVDCLKIRFFHTPLLLVLEDCHWLDSLSYDLLQLISRVSFNLPIMVILTSRSQELNRLTQLTDLPHSTQIHLAGLTIEEARHVLTQNLGETTLVGDLAELIITRAEGNPFYLEELLNYLRDTNAGSASNSRLKEVILPDSLHSLVLSRLDHLEEEEKAVLKVASVMGRTFSASWVWQLYPQLGQPEQVQRQLRQLDNLDITRLSKTEPELEYLFRHSITQEVIYESQPLEERTRLHEQIGDYIERAYLENLEQYVDLLTYHYERSTNRSKQRQYFYKTARKARLSYANNTALEYYQQLIDLLDTEQEQIDPLLEMVQILILIGDYTRAETLAQKAFTLAEHYAKTLAQVKSRQLMGQVKQREGAYQPALEWLNEARKGWNELLAGEAGQEVVRSGLLEVANLIIMVYANQGDYQKMHQMAEETLQLAQLWEHKMGIATNLSVLGNVAYYRGEYNLAEEYLQQALVILQECSDKQALSSNLNNLANVYYFWGKYDLAERYYQESLVILREIGDQQATAGSKLNLGFIALIKGDYPGATSYYQESLTIFQSMGDKRGIGMGLNNLAKVALYQGQYGQAASLCQESLRLRTEIGDKFGRAYCLNTVGWIEYKQKNYETALHYFQESLTLGNSIGVKLIIMLNLIGIAGIFLNFGMAREELSDNDRGEDRLAASTYFEQVAQLLGTLTNLISQQGSGLEPLEREVYEHTNAILQTKQDELLIKVAFERGKTAPYQEIVSLVLENSWQWQKEPG